MSAKKSVLVENLFIKFCKCHLIPKWLTHHLICRKKTNKLFFFLLVYKTWRFEKKQHSKEELKEKKRFFIKPYCFERVPSFIQHLFCCSCLIAATIKNEREAKNPRGWIINFRNKEHGAYTESHIGMIPFFSSSSPPFWSQKLNKCVNEKKAHWKKANKQKKTYEKEKKNCS